jgi:multiple sugar transport system ATP-binding protein
MAEIVLERLTKEYGNGICAVRDLSFTAADGELLVLMGPSGCGKTTTLRLIAGLEEPTHGTIRIGGQDATRLPPRKRGVTMVFQRPALYPHLTVRNNLKFGMPWRSRPLGASIDTTARTLELQDMLDRKPWQLSGGEQQRVALGRALLRQPRAFLLDEPLSNLDARLRADLRRELHLLHRRLQATMIYVTHDQVEAMTLGDRVVILDGGVVQQTDKPSALYKQPRNRFVALSLGSPAMNLLDGEVSGDKDILRFIAQNCSLAVPPEVAERWLVFRGRPLTLGVRPENVRLSPGSVLRPPGPEDSPQSLRMEVVLVEPLGAATLVNLSRGDWRVTKQLTAEPLPPVEGGFVEVIFDMTKAHLFDRSNGEALWHPP